MRAIKALRSVRVNFHSNGRAMLSNIFLSQPELVPTLLERNAKRLNE